MFWACCLLASCMSHLFTWRRVWYVRTEQMRVNDLSNIAQPHHGNWGKTHRPKVVSASLDFAFLWVSGTHTLCSCCSWWTVCFLSRTLSAVPPASLRSHPCSSLPLLSSFLKASLNGQFKVSDAINSLSLPLTKTFSDSTLVVIPAIVF